MIDLTESRDINEGDEAKEDEEVKEIINLMDSNEKDGKEEEEVEVVKVVSSNRNNLNNPTYLYSENSSQKEHSSNDTTSKIQRKRAKIPRVMAKQKVTKKSLNLNEKRLIYFGEKYECAHGTSDIKRNMCKTILDGEKNIEGIEKVRMKENKNREEFQKFSKKVREVSA